MPFYTREQDEIEVDLSFTELNDVPTSYIGHGGEYLRVKATEDGLEFSAAAGGGGWTTGTNKVYLATYTNNVGIGTDSPLTKLHIANDWSSGVIQQTQLTISDATDTNKRLSIGVNSSSVGVLQAYTNGAAGTSLLLNPEGGNVGIGILSPNVPLSFSSSKGEKIRLIDGGAATSYGFGINAYELQSYIPSTDTHFSWNIGGNLQTSGVLELMRLSSNGSLSIGGQQGLSKLEVVGNIGIYEYNTTTGSPIGGSIYVGDLNFYNPSFYNKAPGISALYNASQGVAASLGFYTYYGGSRVERAILTAEGNLGIGTTNPSSKFEVKNTNTIGIEPNGTEYQELLSGVNILTDNNLFFSSSNGTVDKKIGITYYQGGFGYRSALEIANTATGFGNLLLMKSGGNVGIRTSSPNFPLHVVKDVIVTNLDSYAAGFTRTADDTGVYIGYSAASNVGLIDAFRNGYTNNNLSIGYNSSNIGIGTISQKNKLSVKSDSSYVEIGTIASGYGAIGFMDALLDTSNYAISGDNTGNTYLNYSTGKILGIRKNNASVASFNSSGYFGIGVAPDFPLTVYGASGVQMRITDGTKSMYFGGSWIGGIPSFGTNTTESMSIVTNNTSRLFLKSDGLVGVGNTDPTYKLDVTGTIRATDYVYEDGTYAEIYLNGGSTAQSIPTGATYTKITGFTDNGNYSNCTADATNDKITVTKAGKYRITINASSKSGTAGVTFTTAIFVNGTEVVNNHLMRKFLNAGDTFSASMTGIEIVGANQDIDIRVKHDNGGSVNLTPVYLNLNVEYMGE